MNHTVRIKDSIVYGFKSTRNSLLFNVLWSVIIFALLVVSIVALSVFGIFSNFDIRTSSPNFLLMGSVSVLFFIFVSFVYYSSSYLSVWKFRFNPDRGSLPLKSIFDPQKPYLLLFGLIFLEYITVFGLYFLPEYLHDNVILSSVSVVVLIVFSKIYQFLPFVVIDDDGFDRESFVGTMKFIFSFKNFFKLIVLDIVLSIVSTLLILVTFGLAFFVTIPFVYCVYASIYFYSLKPYLAELSEIDAQ